MVKSPHVNDQSIKNTAIPQQIDRSATTLMAKSKAAAHNHSSVPFSIPMGTLGELTDLAKLELKLAEAKKLVEDNERAVEAARNVQIEHRKTIIASMPAMLGCTTIDELIFALQTRDGKPANGRTKMTDEKEKELVKLVKEGRTAKEIGEIMKISMPTVNAYKEKHGLTKKRSAKLAIA